MSNVLDGQQEVGDLTYAVFTVLSYILYNMLYKLQ